MHFGPGIITTFPVNFAFTSLLIIRFIGMQTNAGTVFLKSVSEGTYDAIIVDAFDPISTIISFTISN